MKWPETEGKSIIINGREKMENEKEKRIEDNKKNEKKIENKTIGRTNTRNA